MTHREFERLCRSCGERLERTAPEPRGRGAARSKPSTALVHRDRWHETLAWSLAELGFELLANPHSLRAARQRGRRIHRVASGGSLVGFWDRNQNFLGSMVGAFLGSMFRGGVDVSVHNDDDDQGEVVH